MNATLLTIGIAIILAGIAALIAPFVINWSDQRDFFETQASRLVGQPVTIAGDIDARILPEPRFRFAEMTIGLPDAAPEERVAVGEIEVSLAVGALLRGFAEITAARIQAPQIALAIEEDGRLTVPDLLSTAGFDPARISAEIVDIADGSIDLVDRRTDQRWEFRDVSGGASVRALVGPYRFDGGMTIDGVRYGVRLLTGRRDGATLPIRVGVESAGEPLQVDLIGNASITAGEPGFAGDVIVQYGLSDQMVEDPRGFWRVEGDAVIDSNRLLLREANAQIGPADRELKVTGTVTAPLSGDGVIDIVASGRQLDLDRFLGATPEQPARPGAAARLFLQMAHRIALWSDAGISLRITGDAGAVVLGGDIVQGVAIDAESEGSALRITGAEAILPGNASFVTAGLLTPSGPDPRFEGSMSLTALNVAPTVRWLSSGSYRSRPQAERVVSGLSMSADFVLDQRGFRAEQFSGLLQDVPFDGGFTYSVATADTRASMALSLNAGSLDLAPLTLAEMPDLLLRDAGEIGGGELALDLDVDIGRIVFSDTTLDTVKADMTIADGIVDLRDFEIADLLGAKIGGEGSITGWPQEPDGAISLTVTAERLDRLEAVLVEALKDVETPVFDPAMVRRFEPAELAVQLEAGRSEERARLIVDASGAAANSALALSGEFETYGAGQEEERFLSIDLDLRNPSSAELAGQFAIAPIGSGGRLDDLLADPVSGQISLLASGSLADGLETLIEGDMFDLAFSANGVTRFAAGGAPTVDLFTETSGDDLTAIARFLGLGSSVDLGRGAALRMSLEGTPRRFELGTIDGSLAGTAVTGRLAVDRSGTRPRISGRLAPERADLGWLTAAVLDADTLAPVRDETGRLPDTVLTGAPLLGLEGSVDVTVPTLAVGDGLAITDAAFRLALRDGTFAVDELTGSIFGGTATARFDLTPTVAGLVADGQVSLDNAALSEVVAVLSTARPATGRLAMTVQAEGQGRSVRSLVSSLSGEGRLELSDLSIRGLNPNAFPLIVRASDAGIPLDDAEVERVFTDHLDAGPLSVDRADAAFSIVGGVVRMSNFILDGGQARVRLSGQVDLAKATMQSTLIIAPEGDAALVDRQTEVVVTHAGPLDAPERTVDVGALSGYLNVRRFESEVERVETLQADILERQRLSREIVRHRQELARLAAPPPQPEPEPQAAPEPAPDPAPQPAPEPQANPAPANPPPAPEPAAVPAPPPPPVEIPAAAIPAPQGTFEQRIREVLREEGVLQPLKQGIETAPLEPLVPPPIDLSPPRVNQ